MEQVQSRRYCVLLTVTTISLLGLFFGYLQLPVVDFRRPLRQNQGNFSVAILPRNQSTENISIGLLALHRLSAGGVKQVPTGPVPGGCNIQQVLKKTSSSGLIKPDCKSSAFLVYVCGNALCGGLGDRFKGIISTFLLALLTNRTFVIRHSKPCSLDQSLVPNLYDWTHCQEYIASNTRTLQTKTVSFIDGALNRYFKAKGQKAIQELLDKRVTYILTNDNIVPDVVKGNRTRLDIPPAFTSRNCHVDSDVLDILFKPSAKLCTDIQFFTLQNKGKSMVCSHLRVGQNPSIPTDMKRNLNTSTILHFLDRYNQSSKHTILVATDSESVRQQVLRRYSNALSTGRPIIHIDRFKHNGKECAGLYAAVMDMQLLSRCDLLVLSDSGYGIKAAQFRASSDNLFCHHPKRNIIIPCSYDKLFSSFK